jgi:hypothetical protein
MEKANKIGRDVEHLKAGVLVRVEVDHVADGAVREAGAVDGDVVLRSPLSTE